eukprot:jgi/Mesen1/6942/ME000036S06265
MTCSEASEPLHCAPAAAEIGKRGAAAGGKSPDDPQGDGGARRAAVEAAMRELRAEMGDDVVQWMHSAERRDVPVISTGSLALDAALGTGGYPRVRFCVFIDVEHALDIGMAKALGVDIESLVFTQPSSGEEALTILDHFVRSRTVAALVPKAELEGEMGDTHMGLQARLMSQALRKLTASMGHSPRTAVILINQLRTKIGTFGFGPPEVTTGGKAIQYYASVRLDIRRTGQVKRGEEVVGNMVRVKVAKNKLAPPFRLAEFEIEFGRGISQEGELLDLAVKHKIFSKSGAWYSYKGANFAQGRDKAKTYLAEKENLQVFEEVGQEVRRLLLNPASAQAGADAGGVAEGSGAAQDLEMDGTGAEDDGDLPPEAAATP